MKILLASFCLLLSSAALLPAQEMLTNDLGETLLQSQAGAQAGIVPAHRKISGSEPGLADLIRGHIAADSASLGRRAGGDIAYEPFAISRAPLAPVAASSSPADAPAWTMPKVPSVNVQVFAMAAGLVLAGSLGLSLRHRQRV